jgi:hypothetical protein
MNNSKDNMNNSKDNMNNSKDNMNNSKDNMNNSKDNMKDNMKENINISKTDISKKESYVIGTLNNKNNVTKFYYDSKDNMIKFEQTPDIYYSLLLNSEYTFQKGVAFKDILPLNFEKKKNMMKDNVYYINSVLKTPLGMTHSKLSNMELTMNSIDINKHFKGFLDSKYNIIIEPLSHVIHLNDFYKLEDMFKTKCSLMPIVMDIPYDGIELCNLLKYMTIQNENIFGIILLSNRRSFIYVYSKFSKANHIKIHSYILTELYKTNGITLKQSDIKELFIEDTKICKDMKENIDISKNVDFKNLKELLPLKINEIFYIVIFVLLHYFEILKNKILKLKKKITYNLIEDLPIQNVKYDFSINTSFLNREWSEKLRQYCIIQNMNINDFLQIICSSIIQKTDSNINIYNTLKTDKNKLTYSRYSGCPMMNESPSLLPIYTRLYSSVREKIKFALSEKLTLKRNAIYTNSNIAMMPVSAKPTHIGTFYSGSMRNTIGAVEFIDGSYGEINYNIFGIKVSNMYLIMSSVLWEMRELLQFILT